MDRLSRELIRDTDSNNYRYCLYQPNSCFGGSSCSQPKRFFHMSMKTCIVYCYQPNVRHSPFWVANFSVLFYGLQLTYQGLLHSQICLHTYVLNLRYIQFSVIQSLRKAHPRETCAPNPKPMSSHQSQSPN